MRLMRWVDMMSLLCHMLLVFINSRLLGFCYCCFVALFLFVVGCFDFFVVVVVVVVVVVMIYGIVFCFVYVVLFLFFSFVVCCYDCVVDYVII